MKKTPLEIAEAIRKLKVLNARILDSSDSISQMILITDFIIDFDDYYINEDMEIHFNLWEDVLIELKKIDVIKNN